MQTGQGLVVFLVPVTEGRTPVPHRSAEFLPVERVSERGGKPGARLRIAGGVAAKLAHMPRTAIVIRPRARQLQLVRATKNAAHIAQGHIGRIVSVGTGGIVRQDLA